MWKQSWYFCLCMRFLLKFIELFEPRTTTFFVDFFQLLFSCPVEQFCGVINIRNTFEKIFQINSEFGDIINSRTAIAGAIIGLLLVFFTIQRIWIVLGLCLFFKICSHIFMIYEVKLE